MKHRWCITTLGVCGWTQTYMHVERCAWAYSIPGRAAVVRGGTRPTPPCFKSLSPFKHWFSTPNHISMSLVTQPKPTPLMVNRSLLLIMRTLSSSLAKPCSTPSAGRLRYRFLLITFPLNLLVFNGAGHNLDLTLVITWPVGLVIWSTLSVLSRLSVCYSSG